MSRLFTSESVTEGHPDKVCDQISDAVLDDVLAHDRAAHVACEVMATRDKVIISGEIGSSYKPDVASIVKEVLTRIGYTDPEAAFSTKNVEVIDLINKQSQEIADGVDKSLEEREGTSLDDLNKQGAGDQGMMFGYACRETADSLMPAPIVLANALTYKLACVRKNGTLPWLRPDGKAQVTVEYDDKGRVERVDTVVISAQTIDGVNEGQIYDSILHCVVIPVIGELCDEDTKLFINPSGKFVTGGPEADTGLTGRKIIVDTYGGYAPHGGGAFSGKDPSKVDRSGAYAARWVAKNLVAAGLCEKCVVSIAYAIGMANPVQISVDSQGTGIMDDRTLGNIVEFVFDLRPAAIIHDLGLLDVKYLDTATYGHFGNQGTGVGFPWEQTNKVAELKACTLRLKE